MDIMAPAKLNLYLEVEGQREDGYHEIKTLFERVSVYDRMSVELSPAGTTIETSDPGIPTGPGSLLFDTISSFKVASGINADFSVRIEKNIPIGAGMGGGSSDVASLLISLNRITGNRLSSDTLLEIGGSLGADVPFFLTGASFGLGTGRGDIVRTVETGPKLGHVIVNPPLQVSTKMIYDRVPGFTLTKDDAWDRILALFLGKKDPGFLTGYLRNDLQQIALQEYRFLGDVISFLTRLGAQKALMTGSGPTIFGIFDAEFIDEAESEARKRFPEKEGWKVFAAYTV